MQDWDAVKKLAAYFGIDDKLVEQLSTSPGNEHILETIFLSTGVFTRKYSPETAYLIIGIIFDENVSSSPEKFPEEVFRRLAGHLKIGENDEGYENAFREFNAIFYRFRRGFTAALDAVLHVHGLIKENVALDSPGIKNYLAELRELPCRRLGFPEHSIKGDTGMSRYVQVLLDRYENKAIPRDNCRGVVEVMNKVTGYPGYYKAMSAEQKLIEARPLLLAFSELQLYPDKDPGKEDLLCALSILLFNVYPSIRLLKFISKFGPSAGNDALLYDYYAILAMNYMLSGRLNEAAAYGEKALGSAPDEEKRAYVHILDSCIRINRREYDEAINALHRCTALTKDRRMLATAEFYKGIIYYEKGDAAKALECFKQSRTGLDDEVDLMNSCNNIGTCAMLLGDAKRAKKAFNHVEHVGKYMNCNSARASLSVAYGGLGIVHFDSMNYDRAIDYFKEALKIDKEMHNKKSAANQLGNIGLALKSKQDFKLALEYFKSGLSVSYNGDYLEGVLFSFGQIEQLMALEGRYEEAEAFRQDVIRRNPDIARMLKK